MNTNTDFDRIAQTWLEEGPTVIPDRAVQAALDEIHTTRQRRFGAIWRTFDVNTNTLRLATAVVVAVLVVGAAVLFGNKFLPSGGVGGTPSITPTPTGTPVLSMTKTFVSVNNGFAVGYPADWTVEPATSLWWPPTLHHGGGASTDFDYILRAGFPTFRAASAVAPDGVVIDDWIDSYMTTAGDSDCNPRRATLPETTIDGQAGRIRTTCPGEVEATVVVGRRAYLFTLFSDSPDRKAMFDAIAATIDLRPEGAPAATPWPASP
jgi:hypothetical protein